MIQRAIEDLPALYESDETAWLEAMSELVRQGRHDQLDYAHLEEYLADRARRDRREVEGRLTVLITHLLKWARQPRKRSRSWRGTIITQRQELADDVQGGVLRNHAEAVLPKVYAKAVARAAAETGLPAETFPAACPYTLDQLLSSEIS